MSELTVAVGGPPGSGKSTAGRTVAERLHLTYVSAGELFRAEAKQRGVDLAEFSRLAEKDPSIDRRLDDRMLSLARPGTLLDGRVSGPLCRRAGIPCRYVLVTAREAVRLQRLARRDGTPPELTERLTREREASERRRYLAYYGLDLDREPADIVVDSSEVGPDEVAERILTALARQVRP